MIGKASEYGVDYFMMKPQSIIEVCNTVVDVIKNNDDIKTIKYLLQCSKYLELQLFDLLETIPFSPESIKETLCGLIIEENNMQYADFAPLIDRCLTYKMFPEQIKYMTNPDNSFSSYAMEQVAIGFLNGLTVNDMKKIFSEPEIRTLHRTKVDKIFYEAVKDKLSRLNNEEDIVIRTDWFEENLEI